MSSRKWVEQAYKQSGPVINIPIAGMWLYRCISPVPGNGFMQLIYKDEEYDLEIECRQRVCVYIDDAWLELDVNSADYSAASDILGKRISAAVVWREDSLSGEELQGELHI